MSGFVAIFMCPIFLGVLFAFPAAGHGASDALELFDVFCVGGVIGLLFGAIVLLGIAISAVLHSDADERGYRRQFVLGGLLAIGFYVAFGLFALQAVRDWIAPFGSIV